MDFHILPLKIVNVFINYFTKSIMRYQTWKQCQRRNLWATKVPTLIQMFKSKLKTIQVTYTSKRKLVRIWRRESCWFSPLRFGFHRMRGKKRVTGRVENFKRISGSSSSNDDLGDDPSFTSLVESNRTRSLSHLWERWSENFEDSP